MKLLFFFLFSVNAWAGYLESQVSATQMLPEFTDKKQESTTWTFSLKGTFAHTPSFRSSIMVRTFHKNEFGGIPYVAESTSEVDGIDRPIISAYQLLDGTWLVGTRAYFHLGIPAFMSSQPERTEVLRFWSGELGFHFDGEHPLGIPFAEIVGTIRTGPPTIEQPRLSTIQSPSLKLAFGLKHFYDKFLFWGGFDFVQYFFGVETNSPIVEEKAGIRSASGHGNLGFTYAPKSYEHNIVYSFTYAQPYYISHAATVERVLDPLGEGVLGRTLTFSIVGEY